MSNEIVINALVDNLRRVFIKMHKNLELNERDSSMIDLVNHADTLAQNIQLLLGSK